MLRSLITLFTLYFSLAQAQEIVISSNDLQSKMEMGLRYLEATQQQSTSGTDYFKGEWPSTINNEARILFLGKKGKKAYDSNCFTTSHIHNILAEIYLNNPNWQQIPPMLDLALDNIMLFKHDQTFKFWHVMDRPEHVSRKKHFDNPERYRQSGPNHFIYKSRYINSHANIFDDADDTAAAYMAILLNSKVKATENIKQQIPDSIGYIFANNRDIKRRNISWYNLFFGIASRTHAYMTWFGEEKSATPWRWFTPRGNQPNMPYGTNDVCPMVNANVVTTLAAYNELETPGVADACRLINRLVNKEKNNIYTVYYPTEFNFDYTVAKAVDAGVSCLEESVSRIVSRILQMQQADGSWKSEINNNDLQATLYAVTSLLKIGNILHYKSKAAIDLGLQYILKSAVIEENQCFWPGGVFFSGGTIVKKTHVWKSDAYTTALALEAINEYLLLTNANNNLTNTASY